MNHDEEPQDLPVDTDEYGPERLSEPGSIPSRSEDVVARQVAGETIIVPIRSTPGEMDDIFTLNQVASRTWELIDGSRTVSEIATVIASEFEVSPGQSLSDTLDLVSSFIQAEIVSNLPVDGSRQPAEGG